MKFTSHDKPVEQFVGPMSAFFLMLKHCPTLKSRLSGGAEKLFADENTVVANSFALLFDPEQQLLRDEIVAIIHSVDPIDGPLVASAFNDVIKNKINSSDKMRSIDFINLLLSMDITFIKELGTIVKNLTSHQSVSAYMGVLAKMDRLNPVARPAAAELLRMGIFADQADLDRFAQDYYNMYSYGVAYGSYNDFYSYSGAYGTPGVYPGLYTYVTDVEQQHTVAEYIDYKLSHGGIMGWAYKPGQRISPASMQNITRNLHAELPHARQDLFMAAWNNFETGTERAFDQQIKSSISEAIKRDKDIKSCLRKI